MRNLADQCRITQPLNSESHNLKNQNEVLYLTCLSKHFSRNVCRVATKVLKSWPIFRLWSRPDASQHCLSYKKVLKISNYVKSQFLAPLRERKKEKWNFVCSLPISFDSKKFVMWHDTTLLLTNGQTWSLKYWCICTSSKRRKRFYWVQDFAD